MAESLIILSGNIGAMVDVALIVSIPISLMSGTLAYRLLAKEVWLKLLVALVVAFGLWIISMKAFFYFITR